MNLRFGGVALFLVSAAASAQGLTVIPVPAVQLDASAPHFAYNGHATTFKAIARGGGGTYVYEWDFQGDGTYDFTATTTNRYDLSTRFTYPNQASDARFFARVRVTSNAETVTATYPVHVFADVPTNPSLATARQLQVMRNVAIDDGLWFLHNQMVRTGDEANSVTGAQASATLPTGGYPFLEAGILEALSRNERRVAFPGAYAGPRPDPASNALRWATDPYAEDAMRMLNQTLNALTVYVIDPADEANETGFYPAAVRVPIPGTDDGIGLGGGGNNTGAMSVPLQALATARLGGFVAQVGDSNRVLNKPLEVVVQQVVDAVVWAQNECGVPGAWYYSPNSCTDLLGEVGQATQDAAEALWMAEQFMGPNGVIVPNRAKARLVSYIFQNSNACPTGGTGGSYANSGSACDFALSAAHVFALGWVGANQHSTGDGRQAFPGYALSLNPTRGQARALYDSSLAFINARFLLGTPTSTWGWDLAFVEGGDFSRTDGRADLYAMLHWARAARAVEPEIELFGTNDYARLFSTYLINNQAANGGWNWTPSTVLGNFSDQYATPSQRAAWAVLIMSPDEMQPVSLPGVSASTVAEGTDVVFTGQGNVPGAVTWAWAMGNGDSRSGSPVTYAYPDNGAFNVSSTVTTAGGTSASQTLAITVSNVAPVADAGVDVTIDEGGTVPFLGTFVDPGRADTHTVSWSFGDGVQANVAAAPHTYADNGAFTAVLTVTDDDSGAGTDSATITVRNVAPLITSSPPVVVTQGSALSYTLTFTDPGTADTHTCSATAAPAGATLTGCTLTWTPTAAQLGDRPLTLCVQDDDTAQTCQAFTVVVVPLGANLPPAAPLLDSPALGARVSTLQPTLAVQNAVDAEGDALTYEFEVLSGGARVASQQGVAQGATTTSWQVSPALDEEKGYTWRARAVAAQGPGPWSELGRFSVNAANTAPRPVVLLAPVGEALVRTLTPTLAFFSYPDPDGDALVFDWELAADESFTTAVASGAGVTGAEVTLGAALAEDARYCWRVRADDSQAKSAWSQSCFRVSAADAAPSVVTPLSPPPGAEVPTLSPVFAWTPSADPEGLPVTYELVVSEGSTAVATVSTGGTAAVVPAALVDGHTYSWKVRALTASGPASAFSTESGFTVRVPVVEAPPPPKAGCSCTAAAGAEGALLAGLLALCRRRARR